MTKGMAIFLTVFFGLVVIGIITYAWIYTAPQRRALEQAKQNQQQIERQALQTIN
jgi:cbb3-type cytochrome oxidase subunit 3